MLAGHPHHGQGTEDVGEHHKKSPPGFSPGGLSGNRRTTEGERGGFVESIYPPIKAYSVINLSGPFT